MICKIGDAAAQGRVALEEAREGLDALADALGIVEPVDADDELLAFEARLGAPHERMALRVRRLGPESRRVDADREGGHLEAAAERLVEAAAERPAHPVTSQAADEIVDVERRLEADHVVGREAAQQEVVGRQHARHVGGRPRDVQEEADPVGEAHVAQLRGERDEVVVVHPDEVVRRQQRSEALGEELVGAEIPGRVAPGEAGQVEAVMADGPERPVGEAEIIVVQVALREVADRVGDRADIVQLDRLDVVALAGRAGPAVPQPAALLEGGLERHGEASGARRIGRRRDRHAVRYDDQSSAGLSPVTLEIRRAGLPPPSDHDAHAARASRMINIC